MFSIIDSAVDVGHLAGDLKKAGVETVIRYYNHRNSKSLPTKRLEKSEANALLEAKLSIAIVFQQRGGKNGKISDLDGASGKADAKRALELASNIKQPKNSAIYFAIDHDYYKVSDLKRILPYFEEISSALDGKYRVGIYGSGAQAKFMMERGLVDLVWLAAAKGWSGTREMLETDEWAIFQKWPPETWQGTSVIFDGNVRNPAWLDYGQFNIEGAVTTVHPYGAEDKPVERGMMEVAARNGLQIRRGPSEKYNVEDTLAYGTIVHPISRNGDWIQIDRRGDGKSDGYMFGDFLRDVVGGFALQSNSGSTPYEIAKAELDAGVKEISGSKNNPRIVLYHSSTGATGKDTRDAVAWCSSFVNYCVEAAGRTGTDSQWAKDWDNWGQDSTKSPKEGDIVVFSRKGETKDGKKINGGHVGFFVDESATTISVLGGNQSNRVKISEYPKDGKKGTFDYKLLSIRKA